MSSGFQKIFSIFFASIVSSDVKPIFEKNMIFFASIVSPVVKPIFEKKYDFFCQHSFAGCQADFRKNFDFFAKKNPGFFFPAAKKIQAENLIVWRATRDFRSGLFF